MLVTKKAIRRFCIAAGLTAIAASANAFGFGFDPQILIDRAIGSPTINVRFKGVTASIVELRINGSSVGTRSVDGTGTSGETNFTLNLGDLHEGDNEVRVRIFDRTGKLVAEDKTNISTASSQSGPVYLASPKTGSSVAGTVAVKAGLNENLKDCYVSFFVDGSFKAMQNYPPFEYTWDTQAETNGWHELEAWAIDSSSETHKTGKVRIFVNNVHGDTPRFDNDLVPAPNKNLGLSPSSSKPIRKIKTGKIPFIKSGNEPKPLTAAPGISADIVLGNASHAKPIVAATKGIVMGPRTFQPTGTRLAHHDLKLAKAATLKIAPKVAPQTHVEPMIVSVVPSRDLKIGETKPVRVATAARTLQVGKVSHLVESATNLIQITRGSRLPNLSFFEIALDSDFVDFHGVSPRVDDGVPMTPLRFLLEKKGGLVRWDNPTKTVFAKASGNNLIVHIGDSFALVNKASVGLEKQSYLDHNRTIVPLSFMEKALSVKIQYDKRSNHVLITSTKK